MSGNTGKITINKLLLIIAGECFRDGGQCSRLKDTDISIENQLKATNSHIDFIDYLHNTYGITTDIQLISYYSKHKDILIDKYKDYNLNYKFYNHYFTDRTQLVNSIKIQNIGEQYGGILIIRPDMYLKPFFNQVFDPYSTKICYPSVCFIGQHRIHQCPRVNDTIIYIPKYYFNLIYDNIGVKLYHEAIPDYIAHSHSIGDPLYLDKDFDFFLKTLHDSDSYKDYNPIYTLVSRPENKKWHSYGYQIRINDFLPIEINQKYTFPDWNLKNNIEYNFDNNLTTIHNLWEWWHKDNEYSHLISFINIDMTQQNKFITTSPPRHHHETYWKLTNRELSFYDSNYNVTSILYQQNPLQFFGKSLYHNNFYFTLKKAINIDLNT